jgi:vacuolar protein sorting-associated protein VTA1
MAPLVIPPELKKISPFIKRAEELDKDKSAPESRLVAYYCRQYAVHIGIPLAGNASTKACLGEILNDLEKEKATMDNFTRDEAGFLCRKFAETVFNKADAEDRAGNANKATAKTFYAAVTFLQILEQFTEKGDEVAEEDKQKIIYAKWKATEILKALKEGRTPTPGGYGEVEAEMEQESELPSKQEGHESTDDDNVHVETVKDDEEDDGLALPHAPTSFALSPLPPIELKPESDDQEQGPVEDEGTEVELGPPPAYPGGEEITFDLPPVKTTPLPAPSPSKQKSGGGGMFGFGKKKKGGPVTKAQFADAVELTRFALAALEDKDADLAAERLQQAISALGR